MPRGKKLKSNVVSIDCPVDLDSLILSDDCTPEFLEENLNIQEELVHEAISLSTCAGWLLNLDIFEKFSSDFRKVLYWCLDAFSRMTRVYFILQLQESGKNELIDEFANWSSDHVLPDMNIQLFSPLSMLGNNVKEHDIEILQGKLTLRRFLLDKIGNFLKSGKKDDVDFSYSLFLPQLLNPRFFKDIGEGEQIVILGNLDKYFQFMSKFTRNTGLSALRTISQRGELNPPQALIKHILSGEYPYTKRVKMIAWKQLLKECENLFKSFGFVDQIWQVFDDMFVANTWRKLQTDKLEPAGFKVTDVDEWIENADGIFESFELDCTLRGLDATDFLLLFICHKDTFNLVAGLMDFQDDETRERLFKVVSEAMRNRRNCR